MQAKALPATTDIAPKPAPIYYLRTTATASPAPTYYAPVYDAPSYYAPDSSKPVYVHGYTRRDGTYVHEHTRAAPGTGTRGGRQSVRR